MSDDFRLVIITCGDGLLLELLAFHLDEVAAVGHQFLKRFLFADHFSSQFLVPLDL